MHLLRSTHSNTTIKPVPINRSLFHISKQLFGKVNGQPVYKFHLENGWMQMDLMSYGATILSIEVPDKSGGRKNVVAGFNSLEKYILTHPYVGGTIGRFANRIADGKFSINKKNYQLSINDSPNHLHGGFSGFEKKIWTVERTVEEVDRIGVVMGYSSPDGEEGYPGTLHASTAIFLTRSNEVQIQFTATTDQSTIVNLTNHSYFNLSAFESSTVHQHYLQMNADFYLPKNISQVPTGKLVSVKNTAFDFTSSKPIGEGLQALNDVNGYDHTFVISKNHIKSEAVAELYDAVSGRMLKIFTDQPGIHVYTANGWDGSLLDAKKSAMEKHGAIALELQLFPDAPNHSDFPNAVLKPGETYRGEIIFQFSISP